MWVAVQNRRVFEVPNLLAAETPAIANIPVVTPKKILERFIKWLLFGSKSSKNFNVDIAYYSIHQQIGSRNYLFVGLS